MASNNKHFVMKYFECMHNFAARSMGHVLDGCGEFCPTGAPGAPESLICAACHCHRNFHRKVEVEVEAGVELPIYEYNFIYLIISSTDIDSVAVVVPPTLTTSRQQSARTSLKLQNKNSVVIALAAPPRTVRTTEMGGEVVDHSFKTKNSSSSSVRMRLNHVQKERVMAFAEKMGWRWTKNNEQVIPFCAEIGITPNFLKNWIENNRRRIGPLKPSK
ncbi:hypothetical protein RND71_041362 [Anisodus tanguticus]|uniref:ZF-HD dimerization-type domain-containing protein n=1 Tax=Anisodus tanguticus TaxID=243964 RepID=A0AAE1QUL1_9SOLA|nr:hypothetical protein RND71_041362 [Anisodus tanguticus]